MYMVLRSQTAHHCTAITRHPTTLRWLVHKYVVNAGQRTSNGHGCLLLCQSSRHQLPCPQPLTVDLDKLQPRNHAHVVAQQRQHLVLHRLDSGKGHSNDLLNHRPTGKHDGHT